MSITFGRFDKGLFSWIAYFCGSLTKFSLILEDLLYAIIWFLIFNSGPRTGASLILEKLFSRSSFYDIACFSILANGPHLDATIISEYIFRSSSINAIIFNFGPHIWILSFFRGLFRKVRNSAYNLSHKISLFKVFFWIVHKNRLSEGPALSISGYALHLSLCKQEP